MSGPVLILGGGINGAALARELVCQRVPVVVVDQADIASGATAYSSRLIHGGLRYLEYGEFALVRESLAERERLLQLAPQFVNRLKIYVPANTRLGGLWSSSARFFGRERKSSASPSGRGCWLIRLGLWLYDRMAHTAHEYRHRVYTVGSDAALPINDPKKARWLCEYYDAQARYPERMVVALLADARQQAKTDGTRFDVWTYSHVRLEGSKVVVLDSTGRQLDAWEPAAIVNATGAWVDLTIEQLGRTEPKLMAGTKGSHLVLNHDGLRRRLNGAGLYAEARDGRPVFVLPLGNVQLIGTTDLPYRGDPRAAIASAEEIDYLLDMLNHWLGGDGLSFSARDVLFHYSGVRPLPANSAAKTSGITRRHDLHEHTDMPMPFFSLIGGKLTTCRSLAESAADALLDRLGETRLNSTRERPLPDDTRHSTVSFMRGEHASRVGDTGILQSVARWVIEREWVTRLDDLIERRLMLLYDPRLSRAAIAQLAQMMVEQGKLSIADAPRVVDETIAMIAQRYGRTIGP